jgi:hypothetical protein
LSRFSAAVSSAVGRAGGAQRGADDSDAIWSTVGKPVTGIGAGRYWMTPKFLFFERGTLRTDSQQVPISAVLDVDVRQSMTQKARGVFTVIVQVQRGANVENVSMEDIPHGREAQRIINNAAHEARLAIQQNANTQTLRHEGGSTPVGVPNAPISAAAPAQSAADDPMATLRKLGELRDAGILTEEEFAAKKAEILSRM